jgi:tetratricopeptide (TPR) repeat protein
MGDKDQSLPLEFRLRISAAKLVVTGARTSGNKLALANALKELGNIERRPPQLRDDADRTFAEAAQLYQDLDMPLEAAWVLRHLGINQEYAGRLTEAEQYYDESLSLFRRHASEDDSNYANTVRYPAVIKNRVGKRHESTILWEEAVRRYDEMHEPMGVAEGAAWLAVFAHEKGNKEIAHEWFTKAETAANEARDTDTDKWIEKVRATLMGDETNGR